MVVFDLGGVLIRICRSWAEACAAAGIPLREGVADATAGAMRHALAEKHGIGGLDSDAFFSEVSTALRGVYSADEVRRVHHAWLLGEYPGVQQLIHDIHAAGIETGVLSNTNHAHWVRLAPPAHGGSGEFIASGLAQHLHASHLLKLAKPDAAIYREFARRVGFDGTRGQPEDLLFFDDLEENVAAARGCGWRAERVDHTGDTAAQMRAWVFGL